MLSLCCLLLTVASALAAPKTQIVDGSPAENCEFPSIVYLEIYDLPTDDSIQDCGGTLIDSTHVLTAAHCLQGNIRKVHVNIGSNNIRIRGSQSRTVDQTVKHEGYVKQGNLVKNDIAILTLNQSVTEGNCVQFARMASEGETFGTSRCIAAGWGDLKFKGNSPDVLYKVALPAILHDVCKSKSRLRIADGVLCAGDFKRGGASTCHGDSGGPLYCPSLDGQMVLAGVTSFGYNCQMEISAFSDVGYFRNWIDSHL